MIWQQGTDRAAQQGREMPRHWRHDKQAGLLDSDRLFKVQQAAERLRVSHLFADRDLSPANDNLINVEGRPVMADAGMGEHIASSRYSAQHHLLAEPGTCPFQEPCCGCREGS